MDLTLALAGLIVLAPLLLLIALAIRLTSKGPVLFRQTRHGLNKQPFTIYKFRTMSVTEDGTEVRQAVRNDTRVTPLGRFLRRTSLDELPQLFNVLNGTMSLVGPRPHAISLDDYFEPKIDIYAKRFQSRPGITGLAQVRGFRGPTETVDAMAQRSSADAEYLDRWSNWLDVVILVQTLRVLFGVREAF